MPVATPRAEPMQDDDEGGEDAYQPHRSNTNGGPSYALKDNHGDRGRNGGRGAAAAAAATNDFRLPAEYLRAQFSPGFIGMTFNFNGKILHVDRGSQAEREGVYKGMRIAGINAQPIGVNVTKSKISSLLDDCIVGRVPFTITFEVPPPAPLPVLVPSPPPPDRGSVPAYLEGEEGSEGGGEWIKLGEQKMKRFFSPMTHLAAVYLDKSSLEQQQQGQTEQLRLFQGNDTDIPEMISRTSLAFELVFSPTVSSGRGLSLLRTIDSHLHRYIGAAAHARRWLHTALTNAIFNSQMSKATRGVSTCACIPMLLSCKLPCLTSQRRTEALTGSHISIRIANQVVAVECDGVSYGAMQAPVLAQGLLDLAFGTQSPLPQMKSQALTTLDRYLA